MKITMYISVGLLIIVSIFLGTSLYRNYEIKKENALINFFYEATISALNEIEAGLNDLKNHESILPKLSLNKEFDQFILEDQKVQILMSIKDIEEYLEHNKRKLDMLEEQIKDSKYQMVNLRQLIDNLRKTIADGEKTITDLRLEVDDLTSTLEKERRASTQQIAKRDNTIKEQSSVISQQAYEIDRLNVEENTIYYFLGKKNDLIKNGFMSKSGIFQGSRATNIYDLSIMTEFNLLEETEIFIPADRKNVKVLSSQDASSYKLVSYGNETLLQITNAGIFNKVKYLIIQH